MKKILLIDDEKDLHPILQSYFPKDQFRVVSAYDGLEGLQKCRNENFDLIILDYKMPKMDGLKFYQQVRDLQESKKVDLSPIIFISGFLDEITNTDIKFEKCAFLSKPFEKEALFQKIQSLNDSRQKVHTAKADKISLNHGEKLFKEGQTITCVYYVVSGVLEAYRESSDGTKNVIGKINSGELLGEMAILTSEKSLISVAALEDCELIPIPSDKLMNLVNSQPKWIKLMLENMSKRLRDTIKLIS